MLDEARQFIVRAFDGHDRPSLLDADRHGYTKDEYDRLLKPLPWWSPRRAGFAVQQLALRTLGRLSDGIRVGWQTGFNSGRSLDYVYENRPQGALLVGKWFDRMYLNSVGWRGIRLRKVHLQELLREAIGRVRAAGCPVRLLDIASGPGRSVLEVIRSLPDADISAMLRDLNEADLAAGRRLAEQMGAHAARFERGDAFDESSLAAIQARPNVAVVSGLFELFADNQRVRASLRGLASALGDGGYLIYTGQPWHPQLEMIARVLTDGKGQRWIMRRRTQEELDDLVRSVGFDKLEMLIDEHGIFTVSLARIGDMS